MKKEEMYLLKIVLLLVIVIIFRVVHPSFYILYDYLLLLTIYLGWLFLVKPKSKISWAFFGFGLVVMDFIYVALPMVAIILTFLKTGRILGNSYLSNLSIMLHIVLAATWSLGMYLCVTKKLNIKKVVVLLFVGLHLLVFIAFDTGIKEITYVVDSPMIEGLETPIRIVHISDLHSTIFPENQQALVDKIQLQNPDLILLTGDIADEYTDFEGTRLFLEGIQGIAPIYYVTGNHEYEDKAFFQINEQIQSYGVIHLRDTYEIVEIKGNQIALCGIDDPRRYVHYAGDPSFEERFQQLNETVDFDGFKLLLSHRPEKINTYKNSDFDMILSGHAHGGQVRIPMVLNGLYAPNQGFFPKFAGGQYELKEGQYLIVSRGLAIGVLPRIFNPPEIVYIELW